jgi:ureidoglycolate lyase
MISITAHPITEELFRPYGKVVTGVSGSPLAETPEFSYWSDLAAFVIESATEIGLCTVYRQDEPVVRVVERHVRTPEVLIPADGPFDLPVLRPGDPPEKLAVFRVRPGQAVVIGSGVWHGACLPVDGEAATYFVLFRRGTPHRDVSKKEIGPVAIVNPAALPAV